MKFDKIATTYGGDGILSKEIILKIKEAESEAAQIRGNAANEAAAMPLPREETTPPVTNTYLVMKKEPHARRYKEEK